MCQGLRIHRANWRTFLAAASASAAEFLALEASSPFPLANAFLALASSALADLFSTSRFAAASL